MEIQRILRGEPARFAASAPKARTRDGEVTAARSSADRLELTRQLVQTMEEQQTRLEALLREGPDEEKKSNGILGMLDDTSAESEELDALSEQLDVQMKCMKIAMNMMKGKKVPPEDERYLMENDPDGYKVAIAMKALVKEDKKECKSVLEDEDKNGETEETSDTGEAAPEGSGEATSSSGESAAE